jgi:hypothetical protein
MAPEVSFEVAGYPPAKGEARSMLRAKHSHMPRVRALLEAAKKAVDDGATALRLAPIGMEVVLRCQRDRLRSDATNYLGGIADVLEEKAHRAGQLGHLGDLADIALYDNDWQIEEIRYRWEDASDPSYLVRLWSLEN